MSKISSAAFVLLGLLSLPFAALCGTIVVNLEEPQASGTYSGVGNIRGYAISTDGIARVDLYIDGTLVQSLPYGGLRNDVANVYPGYPNASLSGFSMAYNYSNLSAGSHTMRVVAVDNAGSSQSSTNSFEVTRFQSNWIPGADQVTLGSSSVSIQSETILLNNVLVQNTPYNIQMKWNNPVQGWRITSIAREGGAQGAISGQVVDAVTKSPIPDATVNVYKSNGLLEAIGSTDSGGNYSVNVQAGDSYEAVVTKSDYLQTTYKSIDVSENSTTFLQTVQQIGTQYQGVGTASGVLTNALDGSAITGASLFFREGINARTGAVVATATTAIGAASADVRALAEPGEYQVSLDAGNYTAEIDAEGFDTAYFSVYGLGNRTVSSQNGTATPTLGSGETRIVLTWGRTVPDLDSHLTGPTGQGSERFHVYFGNKRTEGADLDLDDVSYEGPETTTIRQQLSGVYRFSVHDYSNKNSSNSTALSASGARVDVYRGGGLAASFNVPSNRGGTLWTVFELNGNTITPVNSMSYESSSSSIQSVGVVFPESDAHLLSDLPEK